jgi:aryl-alcohol dehydrogenase-like predicted oxidoreductase
VDTRTVAGTGLELTRIVAGAAPVPVARGVDLLNEGAEAGVAALDAGTLGTGETAAERWLEEREGEGVVVLAAVGGPADPGRGTNLSAGRLAQDLGVASRRLGRLDLAWLRGPDAETPLEDSLAPVAAALEEGRIRGYGAGGFDAWQLEALLAAADRAGLPAPSFLRVRLNLLDRGAERDLLPLATGAGLAVIAAAPLAAGRLTDRHVADEEAAEQAAGASSEPRSIPTDPDLARLIAIRDLARARDASTSALAIAWLLGRPAVTAAIVAPRAAAEWDWVHEALDAPLGDDELDRLSTLP